jgi:hypothetical protein
MKPPVRRHRSGPPARRGAPLGSRAGDGALLLSARQFLMSMVDLVEAPVLDRLMSMLSRFRCGQVATGDLEVHLREVVEARPALIGPFNALVPDVRPTRSRDRRVRARRSPVSPVP